MSQTEADPKDQGQGGFGGDPTASFQRLFEDWLSMAQMWGSQVPPATPGGDAARQAMQAGGGFLPLIALFGQAYMQCLSSGLRYGGRLTETMSRRQSEVLARMQAINPSSPAEQGAALRALADDARGFLREVSELSFQEAKLLQDELARTDMAIQALANDWQGMGESYARRWKAKP